jgi:hypothetical protein
MTDHADGLDVRSIFAFETLWCLMEACELLRQEEMSLKGATPSLHPFPEE